MLYDIFYKWQSTLFIVANLEYTSIFMYYFHGNIFELFHKDSLHGMNWTKHAKYTWEYWMISEWFIVCWHLPGSAHNGASLHEYTRNACQIIIKWTRICILHSIQIGNLSGKVTLTLGELYIYTLLEYQTLHLGSWKLNNYEELKLSCEM